MLTTRELAKVVADKGWDYAQLPEADFDSFLGLGSGAAALFGTTGGVMEAALRCGAGALPRLISQRGLCRGLGLGIASCAGRPPALHARGPVLPLHSPHLS